MTKNFYYHLSESIQTYKYRIRTLTPIDPDDIENITRILDQYDIVSISEPKRTPIQESPMDFPNYSMVSVYILDIEIKIPVSNYILQNKLRAALNIPNSAIVVRMENDPVELETMRLNDFGNWDEREPLLSTSPVYHEYNYDADKTVPYGDDYNKKFLTFLASIEKNKPNLVSDYVQPANMKKEDFPFLRELENLENDNYTDGVKPVYPSQVSADEEEPANTAVHGNFDSISRIDSKLIK